MNNLLLTLKAIAIIDREVKANDPYLGRPGTTASIEFRPALIIHNPTPPTGTITIGL